MFFKYGFPHLIPILDRFPSNLIEPIRDASLVEKWGTNDQETQKVCHHVK